MVAFYLYITFLYDPKIFTLENMCHHIFFGYEIWTESSSFVRQKTETLPILVAKNKKSPKLVAIKGFQLWFCT